MCIHSEGKVLGDIDEPACMLSVTEGHLAGLTKRVLLLDDPELSKLNDHEAFELLNRALYLDDERTIAEVVMDAEKYRKFDFLTNGGESFDGSKSFIVLSSNHVRILFTDRADKFQTMRVHMEVFCKVIGDFLNWLKKEGENVPV